MVLQCARHRIGGGTAAVLSSCNPALSLVCFVFLRIRGLESLRLFVATDEIVPMTQCAINFNINSNNCERML